MSKNDFRYRYVTITFTRGRYAATNMLGQQTNEADIIQTYSNQSQGMCSKLHDKLYGYKFMQELI